MRLSELFIHNLQASGIPLDVERCVLCAGIEIVERNDRGDGNEKPCCGGDQSFGDSSGGQLRLLDPWTGQIVKRETKSGEIVVFP